MRVDSAARRMRSAICCAALGMAACSAPGGATEPSYGNSPKGGDAGAGAAPASGGGSGSGQGAAGSGVGGAGAEAGSGAASGTAGSGAAPGSGGASVADAGPDVRFDWPDTPPGAGECRAGRYVGAFECMYKDAAGTDVILLTGPIAMTLVKSEQGEFLEVSDGVIDGSTLLFVTFRATINGRLDCTRARFTGALTNGTYSFVNLLPGGTFDGPFNSQYDRPNTAFVGGTWQLKAGNPPIGGCDGTWTANYLGP